MKNQIKLVWQKPETSVIPSDLTQLSLAELDNVSGGNSWEQSPKPTVPSGCTVDILGKVTSHER